MADDNRDSGRRGRLFVISGPAGSGKDTLLKLAMSRLPNLVKSISATTRPPGPGEENEKAYFFLSPEEFASLQEKGTLLEWARVHDHYYGTPSEYLQKQLDAGHDVILNIDVQGGLAVKQKRPDTTLIFVMPPGPDPLETLRLRLMDRGRDRSEDIEIRLRNAPGEMACAPLYDRVLVNDDAERAAQELVDIISGTNG